MGFWSGLNRLICKTFSIASNSSPPNCKYFRCIAHERFPLGHSQVKVIVSLLVTLFNFKWMEWSFPNSSVYNTSSYEYAYLYDSNLNFLNWKKIFSSSLFIVSDFYFFSYQQWRLIPKLAATYALAYFARTFFLNFVEMEIGTMMGEKGEAQVRNDKIYE